jgi:hypothetical protein
MDNNIYNILVEDSPESEKLVVTMVEQCNLAEEHKINKNQEISYNSIIKKNVPGIKMDSCASRNMSGSDGRLTRLRRLSESRKIVITGFNGSADVDRNQNDLTWEVVSFGDTFFMDSRTPGLLAVSYGEYVESGEYPVTVRLTDAGGAFVDTNITVFIDQNYGTSVSVLTGGPGIVSTGAEPSGTFASTGTITVTEGVIATVRAGAFPFTFTPSDRVISSVTITGQGTVTADYTFVGGYSTSAITLVGGTGGTVGGK